MHKRALTFVVGESTDFYSFIRSRAATNRAPSRKASAAGASPRRRCGRARRATTGPVARAPACFLSFPRFWKREPCRGRRRRFFPRFPRQLITCFPILRIVARRVPERTEHPYTDGIPNTRLLLPRHRRSADRFRRIAGRMFQYLY